MIPESALDVAAFCALGALTETQQISLAAIEDLASAEPEKVFAETLCMMCTVTGRAATSSFSASGSARMHLSQAVLALPFTLHAYVAGSEVLRIGQDAAGSFDDHTSGIQRMMDFYSTQLADGRLPDRKALHHVLVLWMGRISPPGLKEHPSDRVGRLGIEERLGRHVRLVEAFARNAADQKES